MPNKQKQNQQPGQGGKTNQPAPKGADRGKNARHDEDEEEEMRTSGNKGGGQTSGDESRQAPGANSDREGQQTQGGEGGGGQQGRQGARGNSDVNSSRRDRE